MTISLQDISVEGPGDVSEETAHNLTPSCCGFFSIYSPISVGMHSMEFLFNEDIISLSVSLPNLVRVRSFCKQLLLMKVMSAET